MTDPDSNPNLMLSRHLLPKWFVTQTSGMSNLPIALNVEPDFLQNHQQNLNKFTINCSCLKTKVAFSVLTLVRTEWHSRMVGVSVSVNLPLHRKVQKFSSGTGSPDGPRKKEP